MGKFKNSYYKDDSMISRIKEIPYKLREMKNPKKYLMITLIATSLVALGTPMLVTFVEKSMENQNEEQVLERLYQETERLEMDAWEAIPIKTPDGDWSINWKYTAGDRDVFVETGFISEVKPAKQIDSDTIENLDSVEPQIEEEAIEPTYKVHISDGLSFTDIKK